MRTHRSYLALAGFCLLAAIALSGCTLYLGDDDCEDEYGDRWGCDDGGPDYPPPPNLSCDSDAECAAGCYCSDSVPNDGVNGTCIESGYCGRDEDCGSGMYCDDGTCKPTERGCTSDEQCPDGTTCDEAYGVCVPTNSCDANADCPPGSVCNEAGQCVPAPECRNDGECPDGSYCDEPRGTCTPGTDPNAPTCGGTVTCNQGPPRCQANQVPLIDPTTGCYTGTCVPYAECTSDPACEVLNTAQACNAYECQQLTIGRDCRRPDGSTCQDGDMNCTCARNEFLACETP